MTELPDNDRRTARTPRPAVEVPTDEDPADRCPYCGRPFDDGRARDLHVGEDHPDELTPEDHAAYELAAEEEEDELFLYHLKVVAALGLGWMAFVLVYMVLIQGF
ncbi:hypothetical protein BRD00_02695 [Halobacteriales archaeon QS_8_69_26]|nr:MAG: hypothetical protein BRD00_02695 [Halobacteriales archaeon QS_8_69_26]